MPNVSERRELNVGARAFATALLTVLAVFGAASAQTPAWSPPRKADGHPDLEGYWTNSSITVLQRQDPSLPLVLSAEQAAKMEGARARQEAAANARTNAAEGAPPAGGDIQGYNAFWLDRGGQLGRVRGTVRSSWIVDPADGKMPLSEEGKRLGKAIDARRNLDGPEGLNPADRCIVGSRGSGGPPMLNNLYNNGYQIVQTPDHVMIQVEMMHDARIVRLNQPHRPAAVPQWLGDSIGHWEGDTLVVETRNWKKDHAEYEPVRISDKGVVTERFSRTGPNEITYVFTVDDPVYYTKAWRGEMTFSRQTAPLFEYACHEANYAMVGILNGARKAERAKVIKP